MKIIEPSFEYVYEPDIEQILDTIEKAYRICYRSEPNGNRDTFIKSKIAAGHESPLEHEKISVIVTTNRGVSHEIVRHRLGSYSQESQRYCNYSKNKFGNEISFIKPEWCKTTFFEPVDSDHNLILVHRGATESERKWYSACRDSEDFYLEMLDSGSTPEQARAVLNNAVATKIMITYNIREWRHFFELRALGITGKPHPDMLQISVPMLKDFAERLPVLFGDIWEKYCIKEKKI